MSASSAAIQIMLNSGYYDPSNNCPEPREKSEDEPNTTIYGTSPRILITNTDSTQSITKLVENMTIQE